MMIDLQPAEIVQASLFDRPDDARSQARMQALDALNGKFGRGAITYASMGRKPGWMLRKEFISRRDHGDGQTDTETQDQQEPEQQLLQLNT